MKRIILALVLSISPLAVLAQDNLDLTNVVNADVQRKDLNNNVRVVVVLNLTGGVKFTADFFLNEDAEKFKNGTNPEKLALRKKYIRQAVRNYLASLPMPPPEIDRGSATVNKAQFSDPGDTNP